MEFGIEAPTPSLVSPPPLPPWPEEALAGGYDIYGTMAIEWFILL